jgi:hypothetical protein
VAEPQSVRPQEQTPHAITLSGTDPDETTPAIFIITSLPENGDLKNNNSLIDTKELPYRAVGTLTYTSTPDRAGVTDSFTFKVSDGIAESANAATISIIVENINDPPETENQSFDADEQTEEQIGLVGTDPDGTTPTIIIVDLPTQGDLKDGDTEITAQDYTVTGNLTYTSRPDTAITDSFTYKAFDGELYSETARVTLNVLDVNDPPTIAITSPSQTPPQAAQYTITWTANDPDDNAQISLYYDTDNSGNDGTLITDNLVEGMDSSYKWNTTNFRDITPGDYYIYAKIDDVQASEVAYSAVPVIVNGVPSITITNPGTNTVVDRSYTINWTASDDDNAKVALYYKESNSATSELIANNLAVTQTSYRWNTSAGIVDSGSYHIYAEINDKVHPIQSNQTATPIIVNRTPAIELWGPSQDQEVDSSYTIQWDASDSDNNADISLYYDTNSEGYDGRPIVTELSENAVNSYNWDTSGFSGSYYIYAIIDDDVNTPVRSKYSAGKLTFPKRFKLNTFNNSSWELESTLEEANAKALNQKCRKESHTGLTWLWAPDLQTAIGNIYGMQNRFESLASKVNQANQLKLCGHIDWRVASVMELTNMKDFSVDNSYIDIFSGSTMFSAYVAQAKYWSSTEYENSSAYAWPVSPFGEDEGEEKLKGTIFVPLLIAGKQPLPIAAPANRFTTHSDGTVTDTWTGLMWQRCALGQPWVDSSCSGNVYGYSYEKAKSDSETNSLAGYNDWRLPTIKELLSIVAYNRYNPAVDPQGFPEFTDSSEYWSSTPYVKNDERFWFVNFGYGRYDHKYKTYTSPARLVRDVDTAEESTDNQSPSLTITAPASQGETTVDNHYQIRWTASDPDDQARISLHYSLHQNGARSSLIVGNLSEDLHGHYNWDISNPEVIHDEEYYIVAEIHDENRINDKVVKVSGGKVLIKKNPTINITDPSTDVSANESYTIKWQTRYNDNAYDYLITVYIDKDNFGYDGRIIAEGIYSSHDSGIWDTSKESGSYYVYAKIEPPEGDSVYSAYSTGRIMLPTR